MSMLLVAALMFFFVWLAGVATKRTFNGVVHIALVVAIVLLIFWLLRYVLYIF